MIDSTLSRRQLLAALAAAAVVPVRTFGHDAPAGRGKQRDTTPLVPPFEPTGWKTVWLDHLNYQCVDYKKAAAFYATLMGWNVRSDDGNRAALDIGENSGGIIIRGGLTAPPPAAFPRAGSGWCRARRERSCSTAPRPGIGSRPGADRSAGAAAPGRRAWCRDGRARGTCARSAARSARPAPDSVRPPVPPPAA